MGGRKIVDGDRELACESITAILRELKALRSQAIEHFHYRGLDWNSGTQATNSSIFVATQDEKRGASEPHRFRCKEEIQTKHIGLA
jgi:hypothetical protein